MSLTWVSTPGAPTMWWRNSSGDGTQELCGRWSTSSVVKNFSVVASAMALSYAGLGLTTHLGAVFWATEKTERKKTNRTRRHMKRGLRKKRAIITMRKRLLEVYRLAM